jgi:hypothetical protein
MESVDLISAALHWSANGGIAEPASSVDAIATSAMRAIDRVTQRISRPPSDVVDHQAIAVNRAAMAGCSASRLRIPMKPSKVSWTNCKQSNRPNGVRTSAAFDRLDLELILSKLLVDSPHDAQVRILFTAAG